MKIVLHQQDSLILVKYNDILYCQSDNCYVTVHLFNQKSVVIVKSLKKFQQDLPDYFIRISQSFLINPVFIEKIDKKKKIICLEGNSQVPFTISLKELISQMGNGASINVYPRLQAGINENILI